MENDREIQILCNIQSILNTIGYNNKINLPTIIVLGSQSSGKSSVLEHIAGIDFLPRGQGIVTRRPVIIQRIVQKNIKTDHAWTESTGKTDFRSLTKFLQKKMIEAANSSLGITSAPVVVKIFSSTGVNLSLIDMPGLTKIALSDQNENFPQLIEDINKTYIQNPNSILLAVSPANVDVANSDALRLAREFDPKGKRTIGVFTKMDLVEDPNTILKAFEGRAYNLKLGYYGIVCRNQKDINNQMTINSALNKEKTFFNQNSLFVAYHMNCGIPNLMYQLNKCLLTKIKQTLPYVKTTLTNLMKEKEESYNNFRKVNDLYNSKSYNALLYNLINSFSQNFSNALKGGNSKGKIQSKIFGGAKLNLIFENEFYDNLYNKNIFESVKDDEIYWTIKNSSGLKQNVFFSNEAFELFAKKQVKVLKSPCLNCLTSINEEIKNIAKDILFNMKELELFNNFSKEILRNLDDIIIKYYNTTKNAIELYLKINSGSINQKNKVFVPLRDQVLSGKIKYIKEEDKKFMDFFKSNKNQSFGKNKDVVNMKNLLMAYNNVIKDDLYEFTPKCIISLYINELLENCDQELGGRILKKGNDRKLCMIDDSKLKNIQNSGKEIENLRKTLAILDNL